MGMYSLSNRIMTRTSRSVPSAKPRSDNHQINILVANTSRIREPLRRKTFSSLSVYDVFQNIAISLNSDETTSI